MNNLCKSWYLNMVSNIKRDKIKYLGIDLTKEWWKLTLYSTLYSVAFRATLGGFRMLRKQYGAGNTTRLLVYKACILTITLVLKLFLIQWYANIINLRVCSCFMSPLYPRFLRFLNSREIWASESSVFCSFFALLFWVSEWREDSFMVKSNHKIEKETADVWQTVIGRRLIS